MGVGPGRVGAWSQGLPSSPSARGTWWWSKPKRECLPLSAVRHMAVHVQVLPTTETVVGSSRDPVSPP